VDAEEVRLEKLEIRNKRQTIGEFFKDWKWISAGTYYN